MGKDREKDYHVDEEGGGGCATPHHTVDGAAQTQV